MKKVYFLLLHLRVGGIEICVLNVANALAERGYDVTLLCLLRDNELSRQVHNNVRVIYLTFFHSGGHSIIYKALRKFLSYLALCVEIIKLRRSVIISTRNEYSILLSKFAGNDNLKIAQLHYDYVGRKGIKNDFKYGYKNIDYFVLLTDDMRTEVEAIMREHNKHTKCVTIPNMFPHMGLPSFNVKRENMALAVGRLAPEKGFLRLLDIWAIVHKKLGNGHKLYIVGDGVEKNKIQSRILELGIQSSVELLGQLPNMDTLNLMRRAKIYCMSSFAESFGMVLLEAMYNGVPQIAYDVRVGPRNLVQNGVTGFLIPDGDEEAFASRIAELFTDSAKWESMSASSKKRVLLFSENNVIPKWEQIINLTSNL